MTIVKYNNLSYSKQLRPFANSLRKHLTKGEACLWKYALKSRNMKGYQFRRQRPVLDYIADFMCKELKLIIEADGQTHQNEEKMIADKERTQTLQQAGFTVIRFTDEEIITDMKNVIKRIEEKMIEIEQNPPSVSPSGELLSPAGGGVRRTGVDPK